MNTRRAWIVLSAGLVAYIVSVTQRSSLGVAAVEATDRLGVNAATLSILAVVQLGVYAAMQVPAGVLLDRFGPRSVLAGGAALMVVGQVVLAFSTTFEPALAGRILVGAGDAGTFISVLRLVAAWFPRRTVPVLSQVVGSVGQTGQVISSFPLLLAVHAWGWTAGYLSAASLSVLAALVGVAVVRLPASERDRPRLTWGQSFRDVRDAFSRPGTQLGFWSHFVSAGPTNMFLLRWGFPFLSVALGYGATAAAGLLTLTVITAAVSGPVVGELTARFPLRRSTLVLAGVAVGALTWTAALAWMPQPPFCVIVALVVVLSVSGSIAFVGIDFARTFNPPGSHGTVTGFVNVGGFSATLTMMLVIGVVLDAVAPAGGPAALYTLDVFRIAFATSGSIVALGVVFVVHWRRRTRRKLLVDEGISVRPLRVALGAAARGRWRRPRDGDPA